MSKSKDHKKFISSLAKHGGMLRGFIRNGVRTPDDVDELMQRVSLVAWKKIDQLDDWDNFLKWAVLVRSKNASDEFTNFTNFRFLCPNLVLVRYMPSVSLTQTFTKPERIKRHDESQ